MKDITGGKSARSGRAMTDKQKKIAVVCTVAGVVLLIIAVIALICNIVSVVRLSARKAELERRSTELAAIIDDREELLGYIKDNKEFFERYAREYLGYVMDGETVYLPESD